MITLTITADRTTTTYTGTGAGIRAEALVDLVTVEEGVTTYDLTDDQRRDVESYVASEGLESQAAADWDDTVQHYISTLSLEDLGHFLGGPGSTVTITD